MKFNLDVCVEKFKDIAVAMELDLVGCTTREAAEKMIDNLDSMIADLNAKRVTCKQKALMKQFLISFEAASKVTRLLDNNPKVSMVTKEDMRAIYKKLL